MKILLTNDDGIMSHGLLSLEMALTAKGHEVWVCAPESQRSSCSHAVTINKEISFKIISERHYSCGGFPADCVLFAFKGVIRDNDTIDLVISGPNQGFNVSTDLIYSATCAAAAEGVLRGHKAIAVSCGPDKDGVFCFEKAAEFVSENLNMLCKMIPEDGYLNVNVPPGSDKSYRKTKVGRIDYHDVLHDMGNDNFKVCGSRPPELICPDKENTDFFCVTEEKKISISAIKLYPDTLDLCTFN